MIYLQLFLQFLKIGAVSFGGGYGMLALIRETVLTHGWMSEAEVLNFVAVAESTPGPLAINMATYVGSVQGGIFGAFCATAGVVLPSLIIIMLIAGALRNFLRYKGVRAALLGVRPAVVALILATAVTMFLSLVFGITTVGGGFSFDPKALGLLLSLLLLAFLYRRLRGRAISPILLIFLSGVAGILLYR